MKNIINHLYLYFRKIIICTILFFIFFPSVSFSQYDNLNITKSLLEWKTAWENKDINGITNLITNDYEYYNKNSERRDKNYRIKEIKSFFKKCKNVGLAIEEIKIGDSTSSENDVKVVFNQKLVTEKTEDNSVVTMRFFKGEETNNKWRIYREIEYKSEPIIKTNTNNKSDSESNISKLYWYILIIILVIILFAFLMYYLNTRCPKCKKAFVYKKKRKELYRKDGKEAKRYKKYRYNPDHTEKDYTWEIGTISVTYVLYKDYYNCSLCEYKEESKPYTIKYTT